MNLAARLLHVSDTHLYAPGAAPTFAELEPPPVRLQAALEAARGHGPFDAVVLSGDICDDGSLTAAEQTRSLVASMAPQVLAVPGNHDLAETVQQVFGEARAHFGRWQLRGIDTHVPGQVHGHGQPWLTALNQAESDEWLVLVGHHPARSHSSHEFFVLPQADDVIAGFSARTAPTAVLTGHTHQALIEQIAMTTFVGAPSTYYGMVHDGDTITFDYAATGVAIVDLFDDGSVQARTVASQPGS